ncbi:MAG: OB-fold putative lipoprotein [Polaribacter sp.]|nr:OB-fold putative lipoprotein [Polaribacter sp.]
MKIKKIIIFMLVLGSICAFFAYKMYHKPHVNVAASKSDISLSADKILTDFTSDENAANAVYLEKIIEVNGIISDVKIENEKGIITLKTNDDFGSVLCHLSENATKEMNTLKTGQSIRLKGICTGFLMDVILVKCEISNQ